MPPMTTAPAATLDQDDLGGIVDLDRYPLDRLGEPAGRRLTDKARAGLDREGSVVLPGFLTADAVGLMRDELGLALPHVPIRRHRASVYHRADIDGAGPDDPRTRELAWFAGHVTRDMIPCFHAAHRLYVSRWFKTFIAACVGHHRIFEYADPLAGLVATVLPDGGSYPWHYDTNEFVVTIMITPARRGGHFEYHHNLRRPGEENLEGLARVLDGDRSGVRAITADAGDLQLFLGRYSLHRVTPVTGDRLVLVLSYSDRPGVIGPLDRTRSVYGRATEAHHLAAEQAAQAADGLIQ